MSFIKNKIVNAGEIKAYAKVTKWVFLDDVILMLIAINVLVFGFLVDGSINPKIFDINSYEIKLGVIIGAGLVVIAILDWLKEFIKLFSTELALTDNRIIGKKGFIAIQTLDSLIENYDAIEVKMGITDRIFGSGRLVIYTRGNSKYKYYRIAKPFKFQKAVNDMIDARKRMDGKVIINRVDQPTVDNGNANTGNTNSVVSSNATSVVIETKPTIVDTTTANDVTIVDTAVDTTVEATINSNSN